MQFVSDNAAGVSRRIVDALIAASQGAAPPYGEDSQTRAAERLLRETFECDDLQAFFVMTGTAANGLALAAAATPCNSILCHERAHVMCDECGAPEMFTGGAKLLGVGGEKGKMSVMALEARLTSLKASPGHYLRPSVLSLAQANECGAIYTLKEIEALSAWAHDEGMAVHMDGARFANALVALGATPARMSWRAGVDVLSLGVSKNGGMACEAVIFFDAALARDFHLLRKRAGQTLAKGRFLGAQMNAYLAGGHWLEAARQANFQAARLAAGLSVLPQVRLPWGREANLVFAVLPRRIDRALRAAGASYHQWRTDALACEPAEDEVFVRLVTSFCTTSDEVDRFISIAATTPETIVRKNVN